ncbi:hypothetical protein SRABI128_05991 [Microbacterium sp. Bi128]|nr:hypothetical protein SRABI128_05991 [Microbacterium sp. Bi128]
MVAPDEVTAKAALSKEPFAGAPGGRIVTVAAVLLTASMETLVPACVVKVWPACQAWVLL